jgi:RNA polymerase sigma factor (sigma-70 family)
MLGVRMAQPADPPEDLSSTLRHVRAVQNADDADVSWQNLHQKISRWVEEATLGTNQPVDRNLDDLTQDVLLQVCKDISAFKVEPGASFSGWVRTIAQRKLNDAWRRERARKRGGGRTRHLGDFDETGGMDRFADGKVPRQSMLVRLEELNGKLHEVLGGLSDKHKRVIELRLFQGRPFAEIAPALGYDKEVTVRSIYMRALQRLQLLLQGFAD